MIQSITLRKAKVTMKKLQSYCSLHRRHQSYHALITHSYEHYFISRNENEAGKNLRPVWDLSP